MNSLGVIAPYNLEGWLCPALFKYFDKAPPELYGRADLWIVVTV